MNGDVVAVLVQMPAALKRRIVKSVHAENSNANDVIVSALAKRYRVPFTPTGRRSNPGTGAGPVVVRMPRLLKRRLQIDALRHEPSNMTERVVSVLADEFGLDVDRPTRHRAPFGGGPHRNSRDRSQAA
jgi:hypothetical protein